jgi:FkbM family methyltransferase
MGLREIAFASGGHKTFFLMDDVGGRDYILGQIGSGLEDYERPLPTMLAALAGTVDGDFFDIGANNGIYSLHYAARSPSALVHAFEPLPQVADILDGNLLLNPRLRDRIRLSRAALSDTAGERVFYETINRSGLISTSSTLDEASAVRIGDRFNRVTVTARRLDDYVGTELRAGVLKIDVEGHEIAVLAGAERTIAGQRPFIVAEILSTVDAATYAAWLGGHNYTAFALLTQAVTHVGTGVIVPPVAGYINHIFAPVERQFTIATAAYRAGLAVA